MMKQMICRSVLALLLVSAINGNLYAADPKAQKTTDIVANVRKLSQLNITVSRIQGATWTSVTEMNFGTLVLDTGRGIFTSPYYFAIDAGVVDNSGNPWTLTHTRTSIKLDATHSLDTNINAVFMKQTAANGVELSKVSFADSNNLSFTKAQLDNGAAWLRAYYALGSGSGDASGVTPIYADQLAGQYSGTVTITLTP